MFVGVGAKHYPFPRVPAQMRANDAGGRSADVNQSSLATAHSALFAGGIVKVAQLTSKLTAAVGDTFGSGTATIYTLTLPDGVTPTIDSLAGTIRNPYPVEIANDSFLAVVYTGAFYINLTPPQLTITIQTLIPIPPPVVGSRAVPEQALAALLAVLDAMGVINNQTTV